MPDEDQRRYLFAAIDRATRWVYVEILPEKSAACAQGFLTVKTRKIIYLLFKQRWALLLPILQGLNGREMP